MKRKIKYGLIAIILILCTTGCTTYLKDKEGKAITNDKTGQNLVENILCRPTDEETIKLYEENNYNLSDLPYCVCKENKTEEELEKVDEEKEAEVQKETKTETQEEKALEDEKCEEFSVTSGKYDGLWTFFFVKPLAWVILFFGKLTTNFGLGLVITSILIRLVIYPLTKKSTEQAENMKKIQPELDKLEKKYANKDQNDREVMAAKSQEMMLIYKKNHVNPVMGCLPALLQLPLLMAFLDAINRVPAIFEENFLGLHLGTTPRIGIVSGNWLYVILTILVAVTTFFSLAKTQNANANSNMAKQTKTMSYTFTIMIIVMSIFMSSALNIYWIVSNIFTLIQNYLVKRSMK